MSPGVYADFCGQIDAAKGYPNMATKTERALPLAERLPTNADGKLIVRLPGQFCLQQPAATLLPELLASGQVAEITEAEYRAAIEPLAP